MYLKIYPTVYVGRLMRASLRLQKICVLEKYSYSVGFHSSEK